MGVYINHVVRGVVIPFVTGFHAESLARSAEVPMHREVNNAESGIFGIVGGVIVVARKESVVGGGLTAIVEVVFAGLNHRVCISVIAIFAFHHRDAVPRSVAIVPIITF